MPGEISWFGRMRILLRRFIIHGKMRCFLGFLCAKIQTIFIQPTILPYFVSFFPHNRSDYSYVIRKTTLQAPGGELPTPPERLWLAYGPTIQDYLKSGKRDVDRMRSLLAESGYSFEPGQRVMEFGCAGGRMLRWFREEAERCEIWGTDISGDHIVWCKQNLTPPFHFVITTTAPHLPFADGYFDLIYAGSVFSHIDDMADTWLLEMRRVLKPGGRLFITICDKDTIRVVNEEKSDLSRTLACYKDYFENNDFAMFTVGRFMRSLVFYDRDYFCRSVAPFYEVLSYTPEAYGSQTGVLLRKL